MNDINYDNIFLEHELTVASQDIGGISLYAPPRFRAQTLTVPFTATKAMI